MLKFYYDRENLETISDIYVTLDTHNPEHIAHSAFWNSKEDGSGIEPSAFQKITYEDVANNVWSPKDSALKVIAKFLIEK